MRFQAPVDNWRVAVFAEPVRAEPLETRAGPDSSAELAQVQLSHPRSTTMLSGLNIALCVLATDPPEMILSSSPSAEVLNLTTPHMGATNANAAANAAAAANKALRAIVHVGPHKVGSTSLQTVLEKGRGALASDNFALCPSRFAGGHWTGANHLQTLHSVSQGGHRRVSTALWC